MDTPWPSFFPIPAVAGEVAAISSYVSEKSISENCDELVESSDVLRFVSVDYGKNEKQQLFAFNEWINEWINIKNDCWCDFWIFYLFKHENK